MARGSVETLFKEQKGKCYYCGEQMFLPQGDISGLKKKELWRAATFDHIIVRSKGGGYNKENGVCACYLCNNTRSDMDFEKWKRIAKSRNVVLAYRSRRAKIRHIRKVIRNVIKIRRFIRKTYRYYSRGIYKSTKPSLTYYRYVLT